MSEEMGHVTTMIYEHYCQAVRTRLPNEGRHKEVSLSEMTVYTYDHAINGISRIRYPDGRTLVGDELREYFEGSEYKGALEEFRKRRDAGKNEN